MPMSTRLLRPRATGFNPRSISSLALWLDPADSAILGPTSSGPGAVSANGPVKYWGDKSTSGMNLTNSGADSVAPSFAASAQNGKSALAFDGGDRIFTTSASVLNPNTKTGFVVYRRTGGSGEQCIFDRADSFALTIKSTGGYVFYYSSGTTGSRTVYSSAFAAGDSGSSYSVVTVRQDGISASAWVNGTSQSLSTTSGNTGSNAGNFAVGSIGASSSLLLTGQVAEMLIYTSALSTEQRTAVERYLGRKWGITLAQQVANLDAQDWIDRVYANGGTVSTSTAAAVNTFCNSIDAAGIRDRFYRLNLFCGTGLSAALVPLYRGPSRAGSQYGNTTDTNENFVSGDYTETGTSGGLGTGATNSTKSLDTGLIPFNAGITHDNSHLAFYSRGGNTAVGSVISAGMNTAPQELWQWFINGVTGAVGQIYRSGGSSNSGFESFAALRTGHLIAQRSSASAALYRNGSNLNPTAITTNTTTWTTDRPPALRVFSRNFQGTVDQRIATTLQGYSIGLAFTDSQAAAYYTALQTFQTALGRQL